MRHLMRAVIGWAVVVMGLHAIDLSAQEESAKFSPREWLERNGTDWETIDAYLIKLKQSSGRGSEPYVENDMFEFSLPDLEGNIVSNTDERFNGKVVLIDIWGTWCAPCVGEIPVLVWVHKKYKDHPVEIVGIAFEKGERESDLKRLREFRAEHKIPYTLLYGGGTVERERKLPALKKFSGFPTHILIQQNGKVKSVRTGGGLGLSEKLRSMEEVPFDTPGDLATLNYESWINEALGLPAPPLPLSEPERELEKEKTKPDPNIEHRRNPESHYVGVGMVLVAPSESKVNVVAELKEGGSAKEEGVLTGDVVYEVNGQSVEGLKMTEIVGKIAGEEGTTVKVKLLRKGYEEPIEFEMVRRKLEI